MLLRVNFYDYELYLNKTLILKHKQKDFCFQSQAVKSLESVTPFPTTRKQS